MFSPVSLCLFKETPVPFQMIAASAMKFHTVILCNSSDSVTDGNINDMHTEIISKHKYGTFDGRGETDIIYIFTIS